MRSEKQIRERLATLERIATKKYPESAYPNETVPLTEIKDEGLRVEIYTLKYVLDLLD